MIDVIHFFVFLAIILCVSLQTHPALDTADNQHHDSNDWDQIHIQLIQRRHCEFGSIFGRILGIGWHPDHSGCVFRFIPTLCIIVMMPLMMMMSVIITVIITVFIVIIVIIVIIVKFVIIVK